MLVDNSEDINLNLAAQVCIPCKRQKRKCDKTLPACSLCTRVGRPCQYAIADARGEESPPTPEDFAALRAKVLDLESLIANFSSPSLRTTGSDSGSAVVDVSRGMPSESPSAYSSQNGTRSSLDSSSRGSKPDHSTLFFMDSSLFRYSDLQFHPSFVPVPAHAMALIGNAMELRNMIEEYFSVIHPCFPMVSKTRLYQHLADEMHEPGADLALLFAAMKLITTDVVGQSARTQLYENVKSLYTMVESQSGYSIALIQGLLLIGLYELAHAIFPAAYLTTGNAARLALAMGLHDRNVAQLLPKPVTWTEQEERRRVMWAVTILDRYAHVGICDRPFASPDTSVETHLPTDDIAWDRGQMLAAAPLSLSASQTITASPFARTCQASHLLGKVIRHVGDRSIPLDYRFDEALQLENTSRALLASIDEEMLRMTSMTAGLLFPSIALCISTMLTLFDRYCCTTYLVEDGPETQLQIHKRSIDGIREFTDRACRFGDQVSAFADMHGRSRLSPLIIDALYQGTANYAWYYRETSDEHMLQQLHHMRDIMHKVDKRWRAAGESIRFAAVCLSFG